MANTSPRKVMPIMSRNSGSGPPSPSMEENQNQNQVVTNSPNYKKLVVRYKECLKNHAASIGGNATDGCGEFMPDGEEGSIEALNCSACNCHRNFHRKEIECDHDCSNPIDCTKGVRKLILGPHQNYILGHHHAHRIIMPCKLGGASIPSETDEKDIDGGAPAPAAAAAGGGGGRPSGKVKKRFRTKFSQEQKEKMLNFAEKAGWSIQKLDESSVQQFCQEIGIKRRVLKVWIHNNKQSLAKKDNISAG